jgi:hypothetical protein
MANHLITCRAHVILRLIVNNKGQIKLWEILKSVGHIITWYELQWC